MADSFTISTVLPLTVDTNHSNLSDVSECVVPFERGESECVTFQFFLNTVVGGIFCILGLIGNGVSFAVLSRDKQTPIASMLLQALAFADNFFLFWWLIHISINHLLTFVGVEAWSSQVWGYIHICLYPFMFIGQSCTVWLTVFIAFTRYFAVCRPYSASRVWNAPLIRNGVITVFVCSCIYNIPRFFDFKVVRRTFCGKTYYPPMPILRNNEHYQLIYFDIMYYIFSFALPLFLLSVLNVRLIVAYREVQRRRQRILSPRNTAAVAVANGPSSLGEIHRDPNITLVMIIVILIFIFCNLPAKIVQILWGYETQECLSYQFFLIEFSKVLEVLNSATNFIVYCAFRQQFRTILRQGPCCPNAQIQLQVNTEFQASQSLLNGNGRTHQFTSQDTKL